MTSTPQQPGSAARSGGVGGAQSRNPFLSREFGGDRFASFHEPATAAGTVGATGTTGTPTAQDLEQLYATQGRMTLDDVIMKSGILFAILLAGAVIGWQVGLTYPWVMWAALIPAVILGFVIALKRTTNPPLIMAYAALEGVFLGSISRWYDQAFGAGAGQSNIVMQAVIGTFVAFAVMLGLFASGKLRATPRFQKMMMVALVSYGAIALISFITAMFGVGEGWGFYGVGGIGLLLCVAGVGLAAFSLILDFEVIAQGVEQGAPEREAWRAAFGLMVTLVWLYLELLRLLAILNRE